jgi:hypothetical protein
MGAAAFTLAASELGITGLATAKSAGEAGIPAIKPGTNTSFASLKQIEAGVLNVGYAELGASDAPVVILLHGWFYDIHTYVDVAPLLAEAGYRVIFPFCAAMVRPAFSPPTHRAMVSRRRLPPTSSP